MNRVVHVAGLYVKVGTHARQLCGWCGEKLVDQDLAHLAVFPAPAPGESIGTEWPPGALVAHEGNYWFIVEHTNGDRIPHDSCVTAELDRATVASGPSQ